MLAAKGQFQNAYPELMRLGEYRITEVLDAPDGTCTIRVEVPEVRGILHSTPCTLARAAQRASRASGLRLGVVRDNGVTASSEDSASICL